MLEPSTANDGAPCMEAILHPVALESSLGMPIRFGSVAHRTLRNGAAHTRDFMKTSSSFWCAHYTFT